MPKLKEKYMGFYVPGNLYQAFNRKSTAKGINKSAFFRKALEDYLDGTYDPFQS